MRWAEEKGGNEFDCGGKAARHAGGPLCFADSGDVVRDVVLFFTFFYKGDRRIIDVFI
jgi:hypothetical protein